MPMTARERWLALLDRETPDRIPTDFWSTHEVLTRLKADLGCATDAALWEKLHVDRPTWLGPKQVRHHHPDDPHADLWGIRYKTIDYGSGAYGETSYSPLVEVATPAQAHAYRWPTTEDYDYSVIAEQVARLDDTRPVQGIGYEPFLLYCQLRGMEQAYEDLLLNPELAETILQHMFDFFYAHNKKILEAAHGKIDVFYLAEDLGSQTGPLFSLAVYRRFLRENQKKMADLARSHGVHVFYHTDGAAGIFLPDLVDYVGIEVLNPIQWRCPTMERETLVAKYGAKIAFHGAIDNQQTLAFGKPEDVRALVRECREIFRNARWICAPCHNIQPVSPTANIVAMYEEIYAIGKL